MNGVIIVDKPMGFTSFDVVAVLRGLTGQRKIGHCGTLDPNASGVLPVLLGSATRAQDIIPNHDKEYKASLKLGVTTDTLDIWGKTLSQARSDISCENFENVLEAFRGEILQIPPMYSAIQINGRRLYDLARSGIEVERKGRKITVYRLELIAFDYENQLAQLSVSCSKGTYIRSLIDDIGKKLGCGAVMTGLRRISACGFNESQAVGLERIKEAANCGEINKLVLPTETLFTGYAALNITDRQAVRFKNGGALDLSRIADSKDRKDGEIVRICCADGSFIGLGIIDLGAGQVRIYKIFQKN